MKHSSKQTPNFVLHKDNGMLTHNQIKFIHSLNLKKNRADAGLFVVEGKKNVTELLNSNFAIKHVYHTLEHEIDHPLAEKVSTNELSRMSHNTTPDGILAVAEIKKNPATPNPNTLQLCLDNISDPGNLGTIIRTADWFGIDTVFCSENTVDCFNPKVINSSMGSSFRVNVVYCSIEELLSTYKGDIFGAVLNGESIYTSTLQAKGMLVIGSESHGISPSIMPYITHKITIPNFGKAESLNAAIATGIILSEIKRKSI
jgi:RNA methyltransferase, TrmH family